jgi:hypothetical protein
MLLLASIHLTTTSFSQERRSPQPDLGLEILLPNNLQPRTRLSVSSGGRSMTLIRRQQLTINDPKAAGSLTAVDVWAEGEVNAVKVRLSIIYNDLSDQEWWKNKKERIIGSFLVPEGESVRPTELAQFGIVPFEMRAFSARAIVLEAGEGPRITNNTTALKVARLEKYLDTYLLWLQNSSAKNVVAYSLAFGGGAGLDVGGAGNSSTRPLIAAGAISREERLSGQNIEGGGITIGAVVFEDGSFEGDPKIAAQFLARGEGMRIQAPHVLRMIKEALAADDAEMQTAFDRLETQLWAMPEAMSKQTALELLKSKFTSFDEATLGRLYENLKGGFYEARNIALSSIGDLRQRVEDSNRPRLADDPASRAKLLRDMLVGLKENFERVVEGNDAH